MIKKTYLLKYEPPKLLTLSDWIDYILYLEVIWFWGLFKTEKVTTYRIYDHENCSKYFKHWDELINKHKSL